MACLKGFLLLINGNLTQDKNKGISLIKYNSLNLPSSLQFTYGHTTDYLYDGSGIKRRVKQVATTENLLVSMGSTQPVPTDKVKVTMQTDYCGNMIYENGALNKILTDEGYIEPNGSDPIYEFFVKDHQGNNRAVFNDYYSYEQNNYYPFGMSFGDNSSILDNPYKYNGKELDRMHGLDLYDYGARHYDPAIGRWGTIDPLAEKYYSISPYAYCANNPIRYIDPNGKEIGDPIAQKNKKYIKGTTNCIKIINNFFDKALGVPLISATATTVVSKKSIIWGTKLGDKITTESSLSTTLGRSKGLINIDVSANNTNGGKAISISFKSGTSVNINSDGIISQSQRIGNYEGHVGFGHKGIFPEYNIGVSVTGNNITKGGDFNISFGGGATLAAAAGFLGYMSSGATIPATTTILNYIFK